MAADHRWKIRLTILIVFLFCFTPLVRAAVPDQISWQGRITDDAGIPLEGAYTIHFYIYDALIGGNSLWDEQQSVVVADGIYNVRLGAVNPLGSNVFSGDEVYLEVVIYNADETIWETLSPRQKFTSTAFSFQAGNAHLLEGHGSTDFAPEMHLHSGDEINSGTVDENQIDPDIARDSEITWSNLSGIPSDLLDGDNVGITTEADPTVLPSVKDGVSWSELANIPAGFADNIDHVGLTVETDPQVGSNAVNRIPRWNGSSLVTGSIHDNGNIGIGTTDPEYKLDVRGSRIQLKEDISGDWIAMRTDGGAVDLQFNGGSMYFQGTADGENILLNPNRKSFVGIGTASPQSALNILGGEWDLFNTEGDFKIGGPANRLKMGIARGGFGAGTANILAQGGVNTLNLGSGDKYVVTIKNDKVGIGVTEPSEKLSVNGTIESKSGGIKFPDGTTQTTSATALIYRASNDMLTEPGSSNSLTCSCANGYTVLGGGWDSVRNEQPGVHDRDVHAYYNRPSGQGWAVGIRNDSSHRHWLSVFAICGKFTP